MTSNPLTLQERFKKTSKLLKAAGTTHHKTTCLSNVPLLPCLCRWRLLRLGVSRAQGDNLRRGNPFTKSWMVKPLRDTLMKLWTLMYVYEYIYIEIYMHYRYIIYTHINIIYIYSCIYNKYICIVIMIKVRHLRWKLDFSGRYVDLVFPQCSHVQLWSEKKSRHLWFLVRQFINCRPFAINSQLNPIEIWLLSIAKKQQKHKAGTNCAQGAWSLRCSPQLQETSNGFPKTGHGKMKPCLKNLVREVGHVMYSSD